MTMGLLGAVSALWYAFSGRGRDNRNPTPDRNNGRRRSDDSVPYWISEFLDFDYVDHQAEFVKQAQAFAERREKSAKFVDFDAYWPSYQIMNAAQQKWYFFWRGKVRAGDYPKTAVAYIFVHAYELLNQVGVADPQDGYAQLKRLWLTYRQKHPRLDVYLPDWAADYAAINQLPINPLDIYAAAPFTFYAAKQNADLLLPYYLMQPLDKLPLPLIDALVNHQIEKSKFYQKGHRKVLAATLPRVLHAVDAHLQHVGTDGIFQQYRPAQPVPIRRQPFEAAIYGGLKDAITIAHIYPYAAHQPLRDFLTPIVKHTENLLRQQEGHRGRLRVDNLDAAIKDVIEQLVVSSGAAVEVAVVGDATPTQSMPIPPRGKAKPVRKTVEIDHEKIAQLQQESDEIFALLNLDQQPVEVVAQAVSTPSLPSAIDAPTIATPDADADAQTHTVAIDLARVEQLTEQSAAVFELLTAESDIDVVTADRKSASNGYHPASEIAQKPENVAPLTTSASDARTPRDLDDDWQLFAESISDRQREVLTALLGRAGSIDEIARRHAVMPSLLLDTINEMAQDTIGDLLIDVDTAPPTIEEEYREMIRHILGDQAQDESPISTL